MGTDASDVIAALSLEPHPEGGYYRETFRSGTLVMTPRGLRAASSAILFLVTSEHASRLHRLYSEEVWLHHGGAPLELVVLLPDGRVERETLTRAETAVVTETLTPQVIVPATAWQAARVLPAEEADWTLVSCVVSPGFDFEDFELGDASLASAYPEAEELIAALT